LIRASLGNPAVRIALTILLDTAALVIWDIGTRSPLRLVADVRAGLGERSTILVGLLRLTLGSIALVFGVAISAPVASRPADFSIVECWALVTALVLEQLLGPDLRGRWHNIRQGRTR
jgi:hypothetical protein